MTDERAKRAAEKVCETWQVGTASRFCDEAPDWDAAEIDDVASVIAAEYADVLAENERLKRWESNRQEMYAAKKASCVEKCAHPPEFICDYEDGTRHCLECVAQSAWEIETRMADVAEENERLKSAGSAYVGSLFHIGDQKKRIDELEKQVEQLRAAIEEIVIPEGIDAGVILLSDDSPTHWSEEHQCHVYVHENFSPLGDALVKLWQLAGSIP